MPTRKPMFVWLTDDVGYNPTVTGEVHAAQPGAAVWDPRYAAQTSYALPTHLPGRPHHRAPITRQHAILAPRRREGRTTRRSVARLTRRTSSKGRTGSKPGDEPPPGRPRVGRSEVGSGTGGAW